MVLKLNLLSSALAFCFFGNSIDTFLFFSGNYGGALGANALAKGLEGNKSLRVPDSFTSTSYLSIAHWGKFTGIVLLIIKIIYDLQREKVSGRYHYSFYWYDH